MTEQSSAPATSSLTFIGNATTLLRLGAFTVLTDPNFIRKGQWAYLGKGIASKRLKDPAMRLEELPPLDAVVLSHLHADHFDRVARDGLDRAVPIVTTTAAVPKLESWDFTAHGLDTWQRHVLTRGEEELVLESLPGVHGFGVMGKLMPPTMGTLIEHRVGGEVRLRVLQSGDTLLGEHVEQIRDRHPDIDVALVHLGGTRVLLQTVTMDGEQGAGYVRRLGPRSVVPVHYDDYSVMKSPLADFLAASERGGVAARIRTVERGGTLQLPPITA